MAGSLLLALVGRVAAKAAGAIVKDVADMWHLESQRDVLERHLLAVHSLLGDAEAKSETNPAVKGWTKELKAEHVLDMFEYEALRRHAQNNQSTTRKVLGCFHIRRKCKSPVFRVKASRKLKNVLDRISVLMGKMRDFGLVKREEPQQVKYRQTHSALDDSAEIIGRDQDKEAVV